MNTLNGFETNSVIQDNNYTKLSAIAKMTTHKVWPEKWYGNEALWIKSYFQMYTFGTVNPTVLHSQLKKRVLNEIMK